MKKAIWVFLMVIFSSVPLGASWTISPVWNYGNTVYRIKVGDVRRDGHQRMYCGTRTGSLNELSFEGGSWVNRVVDLFTDWAMDVAIAEGRNDGIPRLYVPVHDGHLYEVSRAGGIWQRVDMGAGGPEGMNQVAFGTGRNDAILRAYATHNDGHVYEFTWNQGAWQKADLGHIGDRTIEVAVGQTAHDNCVHVYISCQSGALFELTYDNGWSVSLMDVISTASWGMVIGSSAKPDSVILPLYFTSEGERDVWMYCWVNGGWEKTSIGRVGQSTIYGADLALGNGRNDGVERLYQMNKDAHVYEFSYEGGQWRTADLGASGTGYATGITVGPGRDNSLNHVYACYPNGAVWEYSYQASGCEEQAFFSPFVQDSWFEAQPNPFTSITSIPGYASGRFALYDVSGRRVGVYSGDRIGWDVSPGVYFLCAEKGDRRPLRVVKVR